LDPLAIAITVIAIYVMVLLLLNMKGLLKRYHFSFFGPFLMWRTKKGRGFLKWLATRERMWRFYGNLALAITILFSVLIMGLLIFEGFLVINVPVADAPTPDMIIGIPGINPIIPIGYGIFGLAIAIICHEFAHGVLTNVGGVKVKSMGLLLFIFPIGAFVEPDEKHLKVIHSKKRQRMYAVGPATNIIVAFLCAIIFSWGFMANVEPVKDGVVVRSVTEDYPAHTAGLRPWMLITEVHGTNVSADKIVTVQDFSDIMERTVPGENITIVYYFKGETHMLQNVTLADKYDYYSKLYPDAKGELKDIIEGFKGKGFLGVSTFSLREDVVDSLAIPFRDDRTPLEMLQSGVIYISQPISRMSPMPSEITDLLKVRGPLGGEGAGGDAFWLLANVFYWTFWLNLMVGATNALPGVPLDGGYIFRDRLNDLFKKRGMEKERREKLTSRIVLFFSFLILFLILWLVIGPYVGAAILG